MHVNKRKKDDFSSFVKCGWGGWIGTPAQNFAGPPRDVGLALCFTRACQLSAPNQVGSLTCAPYPIKKLSVKESFFIGWGGWIRTNECRHQKPMPYHLATPHSSLCWYIYDTFFYIASIFFLFN